MESPDTSSLEFHDITESPEREPQEPKLLKTKKKKRFGSLTLRRKSFSSERDESSVTESPLWPFSPPPQITKAASLPEKKVKRKNSLTRILSFGKKKKSPNKGEDLQASRETLTEEVHVLRNNSLQAPSLIQLEEETKKPELNTGEDDSADSFKSVDSPVLCNNRAEPVVDTAHWGVEYQSPELTEAAFSVFENSEYLEQLQAPTAKKPVWKKLFRKDIVSVEYKPATSVVDGGNMSQNQGVIKKERAARGRGSVRKSTPTEESPKKEDPALKTPPPVPKPASPQPVLPDEETLRISAAVGTQILQQKKEEGKRVTGDDLRKQLTEGLKNGSGRSKEAPKTEENSLVTDSKSFIDSEKSVAGDKKEVPVVADKKAEDKKKEGAKEEPKPSTSQSDIVPAADVDKQEMPQPDGKREHLYKILVIGELGTGKTSIIKRYVHQFFSQHYRATIGVDFALKVLNWDDNTIIRLQLWDIAGQERFGNMTRVYYKEAVGAFIVFDVTRAATFDAVLKWKLDLDSKVQLSDGSSIPCVLLANKCDQPKEGVVNNKGKMDEFCREKGFAGWFETSAKENINIEDAARSLVLKILQNDKIVRNGERSADGSRIALDGRADSTPSKSCSC